jgi:hypothetical protein
MAGGGMAFGAAVSKWCMESEARMKAVRNIAIEEMVEDMQKPVGAGGSMPVDVGFLRASFVAAKGAVRLPATFKPEGPGRYSYNGSELSLVLATAKADETITLGWTANYAAHANYGSRGRPGRLFMELGMQRWPQYVARAAERTFAAAVTGGRNG